MRASRWLPETLARLGRCWPPDRCSRRRTTSFRRWKQADFLFLARRARARLARISRPRYRHAGGAGQSRRPPVIVKRWREEHVPTVSSHRSVFPRRRRRAGGPLAYKNRQHARTSMVGHREAPYTYFWVASPPGLDRPSRTSCQGRGSPRSPSSQIAGLQVWAKVKGARQGPCAFWWRDPPPITTQSRTAGHPEAAMAGALGRRGSAGPNYYDGVGGW